MLIVLAVNKKNVGNLGAKSRRRRWRFLCFGKSFYSSVHHRYDLRVYSENRRFLNSVSEVGCDPGWFQQGATLLVLKR